MRVLITGGGGLLARELRRAVWPAGTGIVLRDRAALDIRDAEAVRAAIAAAGCDVVINTAAFTAVDAAEQRRDAAFAVNTRGPENLAAACAARGVVLMHLSSDYVFDGAKDGWYVEDDPPAPLCVYGESKAAGEAMVRLHPRHVIVRTSWLFAAHGRSFVRTMLRLAAERDQLDVVADRRGCPTAAPDLAAALIAIAAAAVRPGADCWGTYHFCGGGDTTWYGFAEAIFEQWRQLTGRRPNVRPIAATAFPTAARRPDNSRLDCTRIRRTFGLTPRPWRDSLKPIVAAMAASTGVDTGDTDG